MSISNIKQNLFSNIKGDIFGGITAGVIALPLALAFGVASGIGALAGLYGAIIVGLFAAIFGGTKSQISGPTGPMTVVLASIVATNPGNYPIIFLTIILAGFFQIACGLAKVGSLIKYVPYPVISGFMSGIGVIIIILQLNPLLGIPVQGNTIKSFLELITSYNSIDFPTLVVGLLTLLIVFFTPSKIAKNIPPSIIALVFVTAICLILGLEVQTIGNIPTALPSLHIPNVSFDDFLKVLPVAITLSILGSVDSLLTSLVADSLTKTRHNSNKELIGQGLGNILSGLFGGIAGAGATMRTVVNIKAGGKSQLSGVIHSLFLVIILLGAAPLAKHIPMAVLAGILIKVGFDIIDYKFLKVIKAAPKRDLSVMILVFLITVFDDLIFAVGSGIVLASILFAANISRQFNLTINDIPMAPEDENGNNIEEKSAYEIRVVDINGVFFFGSASRMLTGVDDLLGTKYLIINCKNIPNMDISAVFALEDIICRMHDKKVLVLLVVNNKGTTKQLLRLGILKTLDRKNIFYTKTDAINKAKKYSADKLEYSGN